MRIRPITILIIACCIFVGTANAADVMRTTGQGTGNSEFEAVKKAYSNMTSNVLRKLAGDQASYEGTVGKTFREEIQKDALSFIHRYFQDEVKECQPENSGVFCRIEATAKLFEFRPAIKKRIRDMSEGKTRIGQYRMVILRNPKDSEANNLANAIQHKLLRYGHTVDLLDKGVQGTVGKAGNLCDQYRKEMKRRGAKSKAYSQIQKLLETCEQNKDVARSIDIISSGIETFSYNPQGKSKAGGLVMDLEIRNGKTGRVDMNIGSERIEDIGRGSSEGAAESDLRNKLLQRAAAVIVRSLNESLQNEVNERN